MFKSRNSTTKIINQLLRAKLTVCAFISFSFCASAQDSAVYMIDTKYPVHYMDGYVEIVPDPGQELSITEVRIDSTLSWRPLIESELQYDLDYVIAPPLETSQVYWGRITTRTADSLHNWILNLEDRLFYAGAWGRGNGKVDIYAYADQDLIFHKKSGTNVPNKAKDFPKEWNLHKFRFEIPVDKDIHLYIRVEENQAAVYPFFNMTLRKKGFTHYHPYKNRTLVNQTVMGGAATVLLVYHLFLFFFLKDKVYLTYSLWLFTITLNFFLFDPNFSHPLTSSLTRSRFTLWVTTSTSMLFFFWFFGRKFVRSKEAYPLLDKYLQAYLICFFLLICVAGYLAYNKINLEFGNIIWNMRVVAVLSLVGLAFSSILALKKDLLARYFGIGSFLGISFYFLGALWSLGIIDLNFIPFVIATLILMVAFSFGLAYRQQMLSNIQTTKLLEAEKTKAEADRIKDLDNIKTRFFSNISHEFRTPLALILGPLQQAKENLQKSQDQSITLRRKSYDIITKNASRLQNLVDQLLDLSKLEGTHLKLKLEQGKLIAFVNDIALSFEQMAELKNINYHMAFGEEREDVFFDKDKLEKIIGNLISNAIKYTPEKGMISVDAKIEDHYLKINIKDTGKGIPAHETNKIFDRFYRAEGSEEKGSGIGLALVKELVDLHEGYIHVNSILGAGTTFKVGIPCALHLLPQDANIMSENIALYTSNPRHGTTEEAIPSLLEENSKETILIVEDNDDLREFTKDILFDKYKVIEARNGVEGEEKAIHAIPDVIISDVMMPKKDGFTLCNDLKSNSKTSHIPMILLTAKAGQGNKMEGLRYGADAYLTKPFDQNELLVRVKNLIDARKKLWAKLKDLDTSILKDVDLRSADDQFLKDVLQVINNNLDNDQLSINDIAKEVGFSRSQLHRKLKAIINKAPNQLIVEMRLNEAKRMLEQQVGNISEIAYSVGYASLPYFTKSFKKQFGILPSKIKPSSKSNQS